jgi:hypothetical protein
MIESNKRLHSSAFYLDNLWRWKCGLPEKDGHEREQRNMQVEDLSVSEWSTEFHNALIDYANLESGWSNEFIQLMRNRLIQGSYRYGKLRKPGKPKFDRLGSYMKRLALHFETGNLECLVDCANMCLIEYVEPLSDIAETQKRFEDFDQFKIRHDLHYAGIMLAKFHEDRQLIYLLAMSYACMLEFMHPSVENASMQAVDDGIHTEIIK